LGKRFKMAQGSRLKAQGRVKRASAFRRTVIALALLLVAASTSAEIIDRIVAVVGGQIITQSDLSAAVGFGLAPDLQGLIDRTLMLNEVRRVAPPDPAPAALDARVAGIRANFATPDAFARALKVAGLNEEAVRSYAADDLRLTAYLDERFLSASLPTDEEIRQAGESARARLTADRRQTLVTAWIAELRRRTEITVLQ
jgi:hypothetical protein